MAHSMDGDKVKDIRDQIPGRETDRQTRIHERKQLPILTVRDFLPGEYEAILERRAQEYRKAQVTRYIIERLRIETEKLNAKRQREERQ